MLNLKPSQIKLKAGVKFTECIDDPKSEIVEGDRQSIPRHLSIDEFKSLSSTYRDIGPVQSSHHQAYDNISETEMKGLIF